MIDITKYTKETNLQDCGVYMITHKDTDLKYIGSTTSTRGFNGRWRAHINCLNRNIGNPIMKAIKNKYGIEGFEFHIIERISDHSIIRDRELYWINYYNSYHNGANCSLDTTQPFNYRKTHPCTKEQKEIYFQASPTKRKTFVYDENGNLCYTFDSTCQCDRFFGLKKGRTCWIINHPLQRIKKQYYPSYELKTWNPGKDFKQILLNRAKFTAKIKKEKGYIVSETQKEKIRNSNPLKHNITLYTLDGNLIKTFISLNECDDYLHLTRGSTSKVLNGKAKTLKRKFIPKLT